MPLNATVDDEIHMCVRLMEILDSHPTHLCDITPFPQYYFGATDVSVTGMGSVCRDSSGQWFMWNPPFYYAMQDRLF